jgi:hypothetical protein
VSAALRIRVTSAYADDVIELRELDEADFSFPNPYALLAKLVRLRPDETHYDLTLTRRQVEELADDADYQSDPRAGCGGGFGDGQASIYRATLRKCRLALAEVAS